MGENMQQIVSSCVPVLCLLITACGAYLVALMKKRTAQIEKELDNTTAAKYMKMAVEAVEQTVTYTAQTFTDTLKASGGFTKEKQIEAFNKSKDKTLEILGDTAVAALDEIYGDFDAWLETKIEQTCRDIKKPETEKTVTTTAAATAATTAVQQIAAEVATPAEAQTAETE